MPLFDMPKRSGKTADKKAASKSKILGKPNITIKGGSDIISRINQIKATVEKNLGQYRDEYQLIRDEDVLIDYFDHVLENHYISIDTETDGLDPLLNTLAGPCIYTYGQKSTYIPINHISYITGQRSANQLSSDVVLRQFKRLYDAKVYIDMFNANFDIRVLRAFGLTKIWCNWDAYLAARLLNDNEPVNKLKPLHNKYCLDGKGDAFTFDDLFKGIPFTYIPPDVGYLYAAHDPIITTELCDYQRKYLTDNTAREDIRNMYWVFRNIEMPCVSVVADMEDTGVLFDKEYAKELSVKYTAQLEEKKQAFYKACDAHKDAIQKYVKTHPDCKLDTPINIASPTQIAILLYDVLKIKPVDDKSPRGTGEDILSKIDNPLAKLILEYREVSKLLSTYIDKLPDCVNPNDGRIHCKFNQYGADTGRFSSSDPNLQNIPSHNKDIRKMFVATNEEKLVTTDTQQFVVDRWCEVECTDEWKFADKLIVGDELLLDDGSCVNVCGVSVNQDAVIIDFT